MLRLEEHGAVVVVQGPGRAEVNPVRARRLGLVDVFVGPLRLLAPLLIGVVLLENQPQRRLGGTRNLVGRDAALERQQLLGIILRNLEDQRHILVAHAAVDARANPDGGEDEGADQHQRDRTRERSGTDAQLGMTRRGTGGKGDYFDRTLTRPGIVVVDHHVGLGHTVVRKPAYRGGP